MVALVAKQILFHFAFRPNAKVGPHRQSLKPAGQDAITIHLVNRLQRGPQPANSPIGRSLRPCGCPNLGFNCKQKFAPVFGSLELNERPIGNPAKKNDRATQIKIYNRFLAAMTGQPKVVPISTLPPAVDVNQTMKPQNSKAKAGQSAGTPQENATAEVSEQVLRLPPEFDPNQFPHYSVQTSIYGLLLSALNLSEHYERFPNTEARQAKLEDIVKDYLETCDALKLKIGANAKQP
jgi:hypothetical protein